MAEFLIVAGMSGAGRSTVAASLEDLSWTVIDNLPAAVIARIGELFAEKDRVALIFGRGGSADASQLLDAISQLRLGDHEVRTLFLDAPDDILISRYEGTRRRHPHPGDTLAESIAAERVNLQIVRTAADVVIDTGSSNVNQLRSRIVEMFSAVVGEGPMRVSIISFGFSNGLPRDVDLVFDCRFLPNPHWVEELRPKTGLDEAVSAYVLAQESAQHFLTDVTSLLEWQIPAFATEGKSYLTIAIGCTGGKHRSVAIAEEMRRRLQLTTPVFHRDVQR